MATFESNLTKTDLGYETDMLNVSDGSAAIFYESDSPTYCDVYISTDGKQWAEFDHDTTAKIGNNVVVINIPARLKMKAIFFREVQNVKISI